MNAELTGEVVPLGIGEHSLLIPAGWETVRVDSEVATPGVEPSAVPALTAGVAEMVEGRFATNVLFYLGDEGITMPGAEFGPGQVLHDSTADGPVRRLVVRLGDLAGVAITTVHLWLELDSRSVLLVASIASERLDEVWPAVESVIRSVLADDFSWGAWF